MLQIKMAPSSPCFRPYVWAYGSTSGRVDGVPLHIPLPARPKQLLTFSFADCFKLLRWNSTVTDVSPRVAVVGPQTCAQPGLLVSGHIDNFTIHFQPSGFNRLFGIPMTELTDAAYDAYGVMGRDFPGIERELGETSDFNERIRIVENRFIRILRADVTLDAVARAANCLFASNGIHRVSAMAQACELSSRQFERRFLAQVGITPKLYARIIRFNAAVDHKLRKPAKVWSHIASDHEFFDQMHLVRDCRALTGESPSKFLERLGVAPEFHKYFATESR